MSAAQCRKLAKQIGCSLDIHGHRKARHITIWLPEGKQVAGNPGLDCLCSEGETADEAWAGALADMKMLADGGIEDQSV